MSHNEKPTETSTENDDRDEENSNIIIMSSSDVQILLSGLCNNHIETMEKLMEQVTTNNAELVNSFEKCMDEGFGKVCSSLKELNKQEKTDADKIKEEVQALHKTLREDIKTSITNSLQKLATTQEEIVKTKSTPYIEAATSKRSDKENRNQQLTANQKREIEKNLNTRKMKFYQKHRAESLSHRSLINGEKIFVPHKFRKRDSTKRRKGNKERDVHIKCRK